MTENPSSAADHPLFMRAYGSYPWDEWQRGALAAGLSAELASLGRSLMREADQHGWCEQLRCECGWSNGGKAMLFHLLTHRHTCAPLMLEGGADILYIQQLLGHAELSTTEIYTQVSIQKLKQIHTACHPAKMEGPATTAARSKTRPGSKTASDSQPEV